MAQQQNFVHIEQSPAAQSLVFTDNGQAFTTSLAIAEGTEVDHASVIKLVRTYLADLEEFGGVRFEIRPFETAGGTQQREIARLNEQQSTLILTYMRNSEIVRGFKKRLVKAFFELAHMSNAYESKLKSPDLDSLRILPIAAKAARAIGLKGNMAAISADQAVRAITGSSALRLLGQSALKAEEQEPLLTVTEIAQKLGFPVKTVNPMLVQIGFQTKDRNTKGELTYELTEAGKKYGVYLDTSKRHGDGTPVRQIKWLSSVVSYINQLSLKSEAA